MKFWSWYLIMIGGLTVRLGVQCAAEVMESKHPYFVLVKYVPIAIILESLLLPIMLTEWWQKCKKKGGDPR